MEKNILCKIYTFLSFIKLMSLVVSSTGYEMNQKSWTYELVSITSVSSDEEKMKIDLEVERISRGVYAISGTISINLDIIEGDSNCIAVQAFRSTQGDGDYKILPFQVPKDHFYEILNTFYKNIIMGSVKECSNLPNFEDKFQPPLEKKVYKLHACQISQDGFPNHLQEGFYKVSLMGTGDVEWQTDIIAEVMPAV